jgi:multidrug efflux pump
VSFKAMSERQQALAKVILQNPAVDSLSSFIGVDGTNTTDNSGRIQINLKPLPESYVDEFLNLVHGEPFRKSTDERTITASAVIQQLQPELEKIPGITLYMQPVQDLTVEDRVSRTQFQYTLEDPDPVELSEWTHKFVDKLKTLPQLSDLASDDQELGLQTLLVIDRDTASRLGITPELLDDTLYDAFGQRQVSTIYTQLNQYHVVLEVKKQFSNRPQDLSDIFVPTSTGGSVPLSTFVHFQRQTAPVAINHQGQFPCVTISFNLGPGASLGSAVEAVNNAKNDIDVPASVQTSWQGTAAAFINSLSNEPLLILAALVTVYIVLGVLYESYIHPITILSTLPSAGVGALLALLLCNMELDVIGLIGIILLIGIVKKNAIMMIDFALEAEREHGRDPVDAIFQACILRFRPITMTTFAALLGGVPLALGSGTGAELRRPLGVTIIGGLILSQMLTLYTTPVIYLAFDRVARFFGKRTSGGPTVREMEERGPDDRHLDELLAVGADADHGDGNGHW